MLLCLWNSPGKNTGVGCPSPGNLPDPGIHPGLLDCRQTHISIKKKKDEKIVTSFNHMARKWPSWNLKQEVKIWRERMKHKKPERTAGPWGGLRGWWVAHCQGLQQWKLCQREAKGNSRAPQRFLGRPDKAPHGEHQVPRAPGWVLHPHTPRGWLRGCLESVWET